MSAWKSRWSWVRLVNSATSKWIASARCSASACEETSIAQASSPPSSIRRKVACSSIASGVVRSTSSSTPPTTCFTVPSSPQRNPGRLEDLPDQEGGGRLPVRPGHPDHPQLRRRVAPEPSRQRRHRRPRVGDHHLRHRHLQLPLDDQRRRPSLDRPRPQTHAHRPSPRARRRTASPARPCGCRKPSSATSTSTAASPDDPAHLGQLRATSSVQPHRQRDSRPASRVGPDRPPHSCGTPR